MFPEAQALAEEALAEAQLLFAPQHSMTTRMLTLSEKIVLNATKLLDLSKFREVSAVEETYCLLSCLVSEFRHLRSLAAESLAEHRVKRQQCDSAQLLPIELILRCFLLAGWSKHQPAFSVFPRLNRAAHRMALSCPNCLGVLDLKSHLFTELVRLPKPRCVGFADATLDFICESRFCGYIRLNLGCSSSKTTSGRS